MTTFPIAIPPCPQSSQHICFAPDAPWLAPLAGYSDLPFRLLCRELGAAVCVTEMVSAKGLVYGSPGTNDLLRSLPEDQPLVVQLFGAEAAFLGQATALLCEAGYRWFDLNMGCSVHKMLKQGAGAAMLGDLENALHVAKAMLAAAGAGNVGFKIRLGLDDQRQVWLELALRLQDLGAGWVTLHPRTARQGFGGSAQREALATLADALDIPVIASGDLWTAYDGHDCLQQTGVRAVMYARGAMQHPGIFSDHIAIAVGETPQQPDATTLEQRILRHMTLIRRHALSQDAKAEVWKMRSIVPRYVRHLPGAKALRLALCQCHTWEDVEAALACCFHP